MNVAYTIKITVETSANSPALALHEAGQKWNETKAKFDEIGGVEVVRVTPVYEAKAQGENGQATGRRRAAAAAGSAIEG